MHCSQEYQDKCNEYVPKQKPPFTDCYYSRLYLCSNAKCADGFGQMQREGYSPIGGPLHPMDEAEQVNGQYIVFGQFGENNVTEKRKNQSTYW